MVKDIIVYKDSWWDTPACDCCDATEMEIYKVMADEHEIAEIYGTAHNIETAYANLAHFLIEEYNIKLVEKDEF